jgi:5'-nucleotidase / UDP-sugar diphosphatase
MIESIRKENPSVLLLDCGAVFDHQRDKAEFMLKTMEMMGYDALNLGSPELRFGKEFLEHLHSQVSFPYIASNLFYHGGRLPWTREYIIKKAGGIKAAILGVLNPDDFAQFSNQKQGKGLQVILPEAALKKLLPEVRKKADLVILLSQLDAAKNLALVEAVDGIDVVIVSGSNDRLNSKPPENTIILHAGFQGITMGLAKITLDGKGVVSVSERRYFPMDPSVTGNKEIAKLVETHKKEQKMKQAELKQELMEGLQLTPEEFMERYRKEQTQRNKGDSQ